MKDLSRYCFALAVTVSVLAILMAGCSVGIKPGSYDQAPLEDTRFYYGESAYGSYYNVSPPPPVYDYVYDYGYDPWTMSTYYEHYSPPQRADRGTVSSNTGDENRRSTMGDRYSASSSQSKAPGDEEATFRRDRMAARERASSISSGSSIVSQKTRRNIRRSASQEGQASGERKQKDKETQSEFQKTRPQSGSKPANSDDKEEEKEKKTATN